MPWWLWPDVLCFIAPIAAFSWQWLFAESTNVQLTAAAHQTLFLTVWIIAVTDRLMEARQSRNSWRHWFTWRYRYLFLGSLSIALVVLSWLLLYVLSQVILELGIFLIIPVLLYLFFARIEAGPKVALPRELVRGALFSAGVLLPTFGTANVPPGVRFLIISQTLLVSLIFLAVSCREHLLHDPEEQRREWMAIDIRLALWLSILLGTLVWLISHEFRQSPSRIVYYYGAMIGCGLLFIAAYFKRHQMSSDSLHLLAWTTLTVPFLALLILKLQHEEQPPLAPVRPFDEHRAVGFENRVGLDDRFALTPKL